MLIMRLSKEQIAEINDFVMQYNTNQDFKEEKERLYLNRPSELSITEIYALEEIIRFGNKGYYNQFLNANQSISEDKRIEELRQFIKMWYENENFKNYKKLQYSESPETLSELETYAINLILISEVEPEKLHEKLTDELEYTDFNEIRYGNDNEIKETLLGLLFGELIFELLETEEMKPIKVRQKERGKIANIDKPVLLDAIHKAVPGTTDQVLSVIEQRFAKVKFNILLGKGEEAFAEYLKYNTNISTDEIKNYAQEQMRKHR